MVIQQEDLIIQTQKKQKKTISNNFMNMIETFKEEMETPLKKGKKRQKIEEIKKSLKETQESQEKTIK